MTFDLKHQLLSCLEWYTHSAAGRSNSERPGLACVPEKVLVDNPVFDVRVAGWMMDPENKKVSGHHVSKELLQQPQSWSTTLTALAHVWERLCDSVCVLQSW